MYTYKGNDIETLSRGELLEALRKAIDNAKREAAFYEKAAELRDLFAGEIA